MISIEQRVSWIWTLKQVLSVYSGLRSHHCYMDLTILNPVFDDLESGSPTKSDRGEQTANTAAKRNHVSHTNGLNPQWLKTHFGVQVPRMLGRRRPFDPRDL